MQFIGIDPGVSGAIAVLDDAIQVRSYHKMPDTERDLLDLLKGMGGTEPWAVLERVHGGIGGPGGRRQGAAGMFTYGRNYGALLMGLAAAAIPFDTVPPQTWQKALGVVYPKGSTQTERKNISKRRAQQLFPSLTVTHAIADALLLADYCRRIHGGASRGGFTHGEKDQQGQGQRTERARGESRQEFENDRFGQTGDDYRTAKERREAAGAAESDTARDGGGPRRRARSVVRIVG